MGKVIGGQSFFFQRAEERLSYVQHPFLGRLTNILQGLGVLVEEAFVLQPLVQLLADILVIVAEDGLAKLLDLSDNVPRTVVGDVLHDVFENPLQHDVGRLQVVQHLVDGHFLYLRVVQPDAQVCREVQFVSKIAEHALEEGVDGHHPEVVVVVQQQFQGYACPLADELRRGFQLAAHLLHVAVGVGQLFPDAVELAEYACLHFLGSLVGEGDGEDVAVGLRILHHKLDVLHGQGKCLAAAG